MIDSYEVKNQGLVNKLEHLIDLSTKRHANYMELPYDIVLEAPKELIEDILKEVRRDYKYEAYPTSMAPVNILANIPLYIYTPISRMRLIEADVLKANFIEEPKEEPNKEVSDTVLENIINNI
jgi:hypothetical protein